MDVEAVLAPLREAGLFFAHGEFRNHKIHVQGGRREWDATVGPDRARIHGWEEPFIIYGQPDKLTAIVAAVRAHPRDEEKECASLEEAVRFILQVYAARG